MHASICSTVKFDTPTNRTFPARTISSIARNASSKGVSTFGQWMRYTSITSVRSRRSERSTSRPRLAGAVSRRMAGLPGSQASPHLVTRMTPVPPAGEGLAHDLLGVPEAVGRRGVHAVHPGVERPVDRADGLRVLDRAVALPAAHRPAPEPESRHGESGPSERATLHCGCLPPGLRSAGVEEELGAAEQGDGAPGRLVGDPRVPDLRGAAAVDERGLARDAALEDRAEEVGLQLDGGEARGLRREATRRSRSRTRSPPGR